MALACTGCGELLSADEFAVAPDRRPAQSDPCRSDQVLLASGECTDVGVVTCGAGFDADGDGGCVARLPAAVCPPGQLAHPGKVSCARPSELPCPSDPSPASFAALFADATHFVWSGYTAADADGSPARPWPTIGAAVAHALDNEVIVVSTGSYPENVLLSRPLTLIGVCPERTEVAGVDPWRASIEVDAAASGSRLRALGLSGAGAGLRVLGAGDVEVLGLLVHDTGGRGLDFVMTDPRARPLARVEETLVEQATGAGIHADGFELTIEKTEVRGTRQQVASLEFGRGISVHAGRFVRDRAQPTDVVRSQLWLRDSLISGNREAGVLVEGSDATIERTVVRDMQASSDSAALGVPPTGVGVDVRMEVARGLDVPASSPVVVRESLIEGALDAGIRAWKASVRVEDSVVRDVAPAAGAGCAGHALRIVSDRTRSATATVVHSLFERTRQAGVHVLGASVALEGTIIRGVGGDGCSARPGDGVAVYSQPLQYAQGEGAAAAALTRSRVEGGERAGVAAFGASVKLEESVLEGATTPLLAAGSAEIEREERREPVFITPEHALCGSATSLAPCAPSAVAHAEPAIFARTASGERAPTVVWNGSPFTGTERLDEYVVWLVGHDEIPVSVSDATGRFRAPFVPAEAQVVIGVRRDGLGSSYLPLRTTTLDWGSNTGLFSLRLQTETFAALIGGEFDFARTLVLAATWDSRARGVPGMVLQLQAASAATVTYVGDDGFPVATNAPQETSTAGQAIVYGALPGLIDLAWLPPTSSMTCTPDTLAVAHGVPAAPGHALLPAFPGVATTTAMLCVVPAAP